ncbi:MAG: HAD-IA family hydrolase, partial [Planctomycetes bacterium]|nr:HAD-IA family hydrolase [Planctomycetota bacterium]
DLILANLGDRERVFDAFVTADDACEHRLKPHPDLYSLALHRMGIEPADFHRCVGVEDTEAGIVSLRAAGVGCAVALPNHDTRRQDFRAAAHIFEAGLPELLGKHHLLMNADRS